MSPVCFWQNGCHCWCVHFHQFSTAFNLDESHDSGGPRRRRRVGRGWRWKIPEEPLALTLAFLVQVVLFLTLFACSLVMIVFLEVPHRRPAMLLKVFLVLWKGTREPFLQNPMRDWTQTIDNQRAVKDSLLKDCPNTWGLCLHVTRELAADAVVISTDVVEAPSS